MAISQREIELPRYFDADQTRFLFTDALGSVTSVKSVKGGDEKIRYDAWGGFLEKYGRTGHIEEYSKRGVLLGYNGKPYDSFTELYNYSYRHLSTDSKQWLTVDPIRDGSNWHAYLGGVSDPVNCVDLWGLKTYAYGRWMEAVCIGVGKSLSMNVIADDKWNVGISWSRNPGVASSIASNSISVNDEVGFERTNAKNIYGTAGDGYSGSISLGEKILSGTMEYFIIPPEADDNIDLFDLPRSKESFNKMIDSYKASESGERVSIGLGVGVSFPSPVVSGTVVKTKTTVVGVNIKQVGKNIVNIYNNIKNSNQIFENTINPFGLAIENYKLGYADNKKEK